MALDPQFAARGAPPGSMRWHSLLYAPAPARDRLAAAFALEAELREISRGTLDHGVAHAKLGWWREEVARVAGGAPRHPLTVALCSGSAPPGALAADLTHALGAAEMELAQVVLHDEDEFGRYLHGAGAAVARLALGTPPAEGDAGARFAAGCGNAIRVVEIIRDLRRDARRGCVFLPWEWVEAAGLGLEDLRDEATAGDLRTLLERLADLSHQSWDDARDATPARTPDAWRPLLVLAELHLALLERIERAAFAVGLEPMELSPLARLFIAWRAARRA